MNWISLLDKNDHLNKKDHITNQLTISSNMIRLFVFYLGILSIFKAIPFEAQFLFNENFSSLDSSSPNEEFEILSYQCILKKMNISTNVIYFKVISTLIFLIISFTLILIVKVFQRISKKEKRRFMIRFIREFIFSFKMAFYIFFYR